MVVTTALVCGSIRTMVLSRLSATQTAPAPTAIALGPRPTSPTGIDATTTLRGSIRVTLFSKLSVTQVLPKPVTTALGALPVASLPATVSEAGSTRDRYGVAP